MFKGMHPSFWWGLLIMYGLSLIFWIWEIASDMGTIHSKIFGISAPWVYGDFFMCWILAMLLAWMWFYFPEKSAKKRKGD